mgnify:FL=1
MIRKKKIIIPVAIAVVAVLVALTLYIFIPVSRERQMDALCRVQAHGAYAIVFAPKDTLFLSLRDDSLRNAAIHADSLHDHCDQTGVFVSNNGCLVTTDTLVAEVPSEITGKPLLARLERIDTLLTKRLKKETAEEDELNYYARTHTVVDDGYNDVMAYRTVVTIHKEQTDSALQKVRRAIKDASHIKATMQIHAALTTPYTQQPIRARLLARDHGLLLLQTADEALPVGSTRFSVYRFGVRRLNSKLLAFNDLGSQSVGQLPQEVSRKAILFPACEGGAWVNRSGHLSGIEHGGKRISSLSVARLMRKVHCWPAWWSLNFKAWIKGQRGTTPKTSMEDRPKRVLLCVRTLMADSALYEGEALQTAKELKREGYGMLTRKDGTTLRGMWHADTIGEGELTTDEGLYVGQLDSLMRPKGQGRFYGKDGAYYEGEWKAGKRSGHGFSVNGRQIVHCGSWKNNHFQGERMIYTADRIYGIDLSRHQHEKGKRKYGIDWSNLRITSLGGGSRRVQGKVDYPVSFAYIKATEGKTVFNKYYPSDLRQARKHGVAVGSYHFFSTRKSGAQQAAYFLKMAWIAPTDLPPVLDLEPSDKQIRDMGGDAALFRQVMAWLRIVEQRHGKKPILYVGQLFVNNHLKHAPAALRNYDVWIARYGEFKPYVRLLHWQLTPYGRVRGIHGEVDVNVFNGSKEEFLNYRRSH